jgi:hypothetical protein
MQDAYETLKGYPPGTFPPQVLIELNPNIPRSQKDRILQMMAPKPQQQPPEAEIAKRLALEGAAAQVALTGAKVRDTHAAAEGKLAKAEKDRAGVGTEAARAGHLAAASHLDAAEFARDTLQEAMRVDRELQQPKTPTAPQP